VRITAPADATSPPPARTCRRASRSTNAETGSAVEEVTLLVDGYAVDASRTAPYTLTWETTGWPPAATLRVVADDATGSAAARPRSW
jgi:hypothetical protein